MAKYKIWESKSIYENNKFIRTYILYESSSYFIFCSACRKNGTTEYEMFFKSTCEKILFYIIMAFIMIIYALIFFWIDLIHYFCLKKRKKYSNVIGKSKKGEYPSKEKGIYTDNIWNELDGLSEERLNKEEVGVCPNCGYRLQTFLDFIPSNENLDETNQQINIVQNEREFIDMNELIIFNFISKDGKINFSVCCKKSDLFIESEKKLLNEYPELLNKKYNYILNGNSLLDKNKSIEELGIKNRDDIIINEIE